MAAVRKSEWLPPDGFVVGEVFGGDDPATALLFGDDEGGRCAAIEALHALILDAAEGGGEGAEGRPRVPWVEQDAPYGSEFK